MKFQNNNAILNMDTEVPYLTFPYLSELDYIRHGFSTRLGGVSNGYFASMNLGYSTGDNPKDVDENYRRVCESMGFVLNDLVLSDQVHKLDIKLVKEEDKGKGNP
jgi:copper oxidase (laccase) domain-containing protein